MDGYFELKCAAGGQFMFNLKDGNHETLTSEIYSSKAGAEKGIAAVRANALYDVRYQRYVSRDGCPHFVLVAGDGEIMGKSDMYPFSAAMERSIEVLKSDVLFAIVKDLTG